MIILLRTTSVLLLLLLLMMMMIMMMMTKMRMRLFRLEVVYAHHRSIRRYDASRSQPK